MLHKMKLRLGIVNRTQDNYPTLEINQNMPE